MDNETIIKNTFAEVFEISASSIDLKMKQNELKGWDSLGQLRLIMTLEEKFNISFDIDEIATLNTFEKILNKTLQKISNIKA
jgi:acyl carrier protein